MQYRCFVLIEIFRIFFFIDFCENGSEISDEVGDFNYYQNQRKFFFFYLYT